MSETPELDFFSPELRRKGLNYRQEMYGDWVVETDKEKALKAPGEEGMSEEPVPYGKPQAPAVSIREYGAGRFEIIVQRGARVVIELDVEADVLFALAATLQDFHLSDTQQE